MQLPENEKSILAYFPSSTRADEAARSIRTRGLVNEPGAMRIDRISRFGTSRDASYTNVLSEGISLSALTQFSSQTTDRSDDERVLLAADPAASGIGDADYGVAGGGAFLLTVVLPKENTQEALDIIRSLGGNA
ncbi:MAG: hypothetical protein ACM3QZ_02935 [Solirubrobacterales bacterium]